MSIITIATFPIQASTVPFCKLEKGAFTQVDLLKDQSAAPLTPQQITHEQRTNHTTSKRVGPAGSTFRECAPVSQAPTPSGQTSGQWPQHPQKMAVPS